MVLGKDAENIVQNFYLEETRMAALTPNVVMDLLIMKKIDRILPTSFCRRNIFFLKDFRTIIESVLNLQFFNE